MKKDPSNFNLNVKSFLNRVNQELKGHLFVICTANVKNKTVICSLFFHICSKVCDIEIYSCVYAHVAVDNREGM